jgi:DNA-binding MarR family transcriptional regulator
MTALSNRKISDVLASAAPEGIPQRPGKKLPKLVDYADLALAATPQTPRSVDTQDVSFNAALALLESLARFKLTARQGLLLAVLAKGRACITDLTPKLRLSAAGMTQLIDTVEALGLVTSSRGEASDRRMVFIQITQAGTNVIGALVALSALGGASSIMLKPRR